MGKKGPCVTANCMIALTDFTEENGATRVVSVVMNGIILKCLMKNALDTKRLFPLS
ncbi:phytanoyl-CoA dioxygenase family protein [Acinetobacter lactucae]|uniref:phytanoyl-CoA dioxygenase family protein n=1 Tax=Acinetobacter lactucae TaxID=1785128 RepID=UPI00223407BD|nr:phytanoyl-CoA dioxygenase family protein [Acinetobacter lactucae]